MSSDFRRRGLSCREAFIQVRSVMSRVAVILFCLAGSAACTPTVQVAAPKEPIEINLNVKIEHHIRVQVDEELEDLFADDSDVF